MKTVIKDLEQVKKSLNIERTFIFGSFISNPEKYNDIDIILFTTNDHIENMELKIWSCSLPISRIQYNCYKRYEKIVIENQSYDIVVINKHKVLNNFIEINNDRIVEV